MLQAANSKTLAEKLDVVLANVRQSGAVRPRTVKTPSSTNGSLFQKQLLEGNVKAILAELGKGGHVSLDRTKVAYSL